VNTDEGRWLEGLNERAEVDALRAEVERLRGQVVVHEAYIRGQQAELAEARAAIARVEAWCDKRQNSRMATATYEVRDALRGERP
jgi:tmRNA-binding protein